MVLDPEKVGLWLTAELDRLAAAPRSLGTLVLFHTRMKLLLMAHSPASYRALGRLVALGKKEEDIDALFARYRTQLCAAFAVPPTRGRHANVLLHAFGYVSDALSPAERREVVALIEQYRTGEVALDVPMDKVGALIREHKVSYLQRQHYFEEVAR